MTPHQSLIKVAAELARGPHLDERFDISDRIPAWAIYSIYKVLDRQRQLALIIRQCADKMNKEISK